MRGKLRSCGVMSRGAVSVRRMMSERARSKSFKREGVMSVERMMCIRRDDIQLRAMWRKHWL